MGRPRWGVRVAAAAALLVLLSPGRAAQAADDGDRTTHFNFQPDAGSQGIAAHLAEIAEDKRHFVQNMLGVTDERVIEVRIASSEEATPITKNTAIVPPSWTISNEEFAHWRGAICHRICNDYS